MKLQHLAENLGARLEGDPDLEIHGVAGIEHASPGQLAFVANPKYTAYAKTTQASAVLVAPDFPAIAAATLRVENPYLAFAKAIDFFYQPPVYAPGIHPTAVVDPTAQVGRNAHIGAYSVISPNVIIGDDATILPHVVIYPGVRIGDRFFAHAHAVVREACSLGDDVLLQNGAIVGCDGFGFAKDQAGSWRKITQSGPTILGNAVEVQANSCIDRASVGQTVIGNGVKVDNLVQVGHGSSVGENTLLCAQVGMAGSSNLGKNVILAGQVGVAGHCTLGDGVIITAQGGVHGDIPAGSVLSGSPAFDNRQWLKATSLFSRLPDLIKQFERKPRSPQAPPPDKSGSVAD
jgi:UDP-3-O-[3-hydroxymyristoyl] glucosamine N-acyltransferase